VTINATIDWGDGWTTPGTVDGLDGVFRVNGTHTYTQKGGYLVVTTITDAG
jgi:hypothetical protein